MAKRPLSDADGKSSGRKRHRREKNNKNSKRRRTRNKAGVTESNAIPIVGDRFARLDVVLPEQKDGDGDDDDDEDENENDVENGGGSSENVGLSMSNGGMVEEKTSTVVGTSSSSSNAEQTEKISASKLDDQTKATKKRRREKKKDAKLSNGSSRPSEGSAIPSSADEKIPRAPQEPQPSNHSPNTTADRREYVQSPELTALPQSEIDRFLATNSIKIEDPLGESARRPITSFSYLPVVDKSQLAPMAAFSAPTPIQAAAWPSIFAGRDVVGVAETGSGKTMAFGVPCVHHLASLSKSRRKGIRVAVVSPTRELALQIAEHLGQLTQTAGLEVVCVYGGVSRDAQIKALRTANIVVGTPGRLNDLISEGSADLSEVKCLVLDEADRMLDKGFEDEVRKIIDVTPGSGKRQTLMFTATWPASVRSLAATFMRDPVKIHVGDNHSGELRANARIAQHVEVVDSSEKEGKLIQLLRRHQSGDGRGQRILVFVLYKKEAARIEKFIRWKGFEVAAIHGDLSQAQRTTSLDAFRSGQVPLLVATDVAARGARHPRRQGGHQRHVPTHGRGLRASDREDGEGGEGRLGCHVLH